MKLFLSSSSDTKPKLFLCSQTVNNGILCISLIGTTPFQNIFGYGFVQIIEKYTYVDKNFDLYMFLSVYNTEKLNT